MAIGSRLQLHIVRSLAGHTPGILGLSLLEDNLSRAIGWIADGCVWNFCTGIFILAFLYGHFLDAWISQA
jgi:hypothetical protein